jgi:hypothetical protein
MTTIVNSKVNTTENRMLYVIHPLDDVPEQKCSADGLGQLKMSKSVRASLVTLRVYLVFILALGIYRLVDLLGLLGHHTPG